MTDNRTNEPTEAQVEAAWQSLLETATDVTTRADMRAALVAAQGAAPVLPSSGVDESLAKAWREGHEAGRDYQGDGWNCDAHDPEEDNPYRAEAYRQERGEG